jgi:hypothetical protein
MLALSASDVGLRHAQARRFKPLSQTRVMLTTGMDRPPGQPWLEALLPGAHPETARVPTVGLDAVTSSAVEPARARR